MEKIKENVPKIRFPGFIDSWEQHKFSEIFTTLQNNALSRAELNSEQGVAMNVHYGDVLIKFGELLDVSKAEVPFIIDDTCVSKYKRSFLKNGDVIIADAAEDETVGKCSEIVGLTSETVISGLHTIPCRPMQVFASGYLGFYMNSNAYHNQLLPLIQGTKVSSISKSALNDTVLIYPKSSEEQTLIAKCFTSLDNLITLHQRKLEHLKDKKKGLLQKMFPKEGEKFPELRFSGFTELWEQRKVQEFIDEGIIEEPMDGNHGEKHPTVSDYVNSGIPFIMAKDITNGKVDIKKCNFISSERAEQLAKGFAKNGDVLITHKATIGETAILSGLSSKYAVLTPQVTYYRIINKSKLDAKYLYAYFNFPCFQCDLKIEAVQSTRSYIGITEQHKLNIWSPVKIEEQLKIGKFFNYLDNLITIHQRKLKHLQQQKKGLLQQMFI